ncbi:hypothetical protein Lesp02_24560 [Lentzea sp. NBRC 105346]|uniref:RICIN domain-containing protein n=1 Tax=Lentzea sp. NBRC 105346 TaxID=3032205 RepID=UPI0024A52411|nr:RICIN domain-containing protein [Lentzea sp. NBRC 105346]GLZ30266.1 hypothetical protein Lesp02_24560 [Lentzea sp. NBRC 105346]
MIRTGMRILLAALAGLSLVATPGLASAGAPKVLDAADLAANGVQPNAVYQVRNRNSGKCLEIYGWSTADQGDAVQWTCHGGNNQLWDFRPSGDGVTWYIVNVHSQKCLEIYGWSTADHGDAVQWGCHGGNNQRWYWNANGTNAWFTNKHSGKVLEIYGWSTADRGDAVQWTWHGGANQLWY